MHVDLITLYLLAIGTLLASAGMTLWEHRTHPKRSRELKILAAGYATLAIGCAAAAFRRGLPGVTGSALSNLIIVSGYLLILHGVASLNRRQYRVGSIVMLGLLALAWAIAGTPWQTVMWDYVSALPIAIACGMTSRELLRNDGMKSLQSRYIAVIVSGGHALFYAFRALILPWLVAWHGRDMLLVLSQITMYEGVLYSVILPMTLLTLIREEAHGQLLQESQTDYLTGLGNRRWFFETGARVIRDGTVSRPVSLLAFDLDHFKTINDRYGHETGDQVLKSFGEVARNALGPEAMLARIGGEEFAALLPGHDGPRAQQVGEALVRRFAGTISHRTNGVEIRATVSVGLAQSGSATPMLTDLLAAADQALYRAKSLGGNRLEWTADAVDPQSAEEVASRRRKSAV
ncbi:GGDEF domain-containing protein [Paraburkholderia ginsengisoli]|uniref:diguanylate cyclase n=1 Tax=Paraburkholderia ginsengisoli TaxID=311231 RepID=A0A7T4TB96_9BURK|nr:GGDEF domain-containing protein [Paraburkholderia ginsengisoli]QQC66245.1 GGDEF domain-containing protein [Paraburkholderia ginsengisoli]